MKMKANMTKKQQTSKKEKERKFFLKNKKKKLKERKILLDVLNLKVTQGPGHDCQRNTRVAIDHIAENDVASSKGR